jgi:uncharacterized repeat protein (TIGR03803 family)
MGFTDGSAPLGRLAAGPHGKLYGTTFEGGPYNVGIVFSLSPPATPGGAWVEDILHTFTAGSDGAAPATAVTIGGGVISGTTSG